MSILNLNAEIIWVFINLAILLLLMKKFLFKPVTKMLDERSKEISDAIDSADAKMQSAEKAQKESDDHLLSVKQQAQEIIDEARKRADHEYELKLQKAKEDIARMQAAALKQAEADREAMIQGARNEIAMLALMAASKVSQQKMNTDAERELVNSFIDEVEERV